MLASLGLEKRATPASTTVSECEDHMEAVVAVFARLALRREGQDLIEYGVLLALIAVVALVAAATVGNVVNTVFWETFASAL